MDLMLGLDCKYYGSACISSYKAENSNASENQSSKCDACMAL
jgi:hypothetical protein